MPTTTPHVVLVHGGFVDGSGWQGVYDRLTKDGDTVTVVQNPTISLEGDVATTKQALDAHDGPAILVGYSYGGAVITEAGNHPAVKALVYIAAFAPDKGESVNTLIADPPPGAPVPPILPPKDGFLFLDRDKFAASFAGDVPDEESAFMADSQVPWGVDALSGAASCPAWRAKPSWYLVTTDDRMIPPPAQRAMCERRDNRRGRGESRRLPIAARRRRRAHLRGGRSDHVVLAADPADLHPPAARQSPPPCRLLLDVRRDRCLHPANAVLVPCVIRLATAKPEP